MTSWITGRIDIQFAMESEINSHLPLLDNISRKRWLDGAQ
jgi:hypothetical protein